MSIKINGAVMPKTCCNCFAFKTNASGQLFCKAKGRALERVEYESSIKKRMDWCPLEEPTDFGEWKDCPDGAVYCSECGDYPVDDYTMTKYCPHCGVKMKNGGDVR